MNLTGVRPGPANPVKSLEDFTGLLTGLLTGIVEGSRTRSRVVG